MYFATCSRPAIGLCAAQMKASRRCRCSPLLTRVASPQPVDTGADPTLGAERCEALEVAVLVLLELLSPTERAANVLREAVVVEERLGSLTEDLGDTSEDRDPPEPADQ